MAKKPQPAEEESVEGAPLWIISFADMISLLMAFFVMLSTFSGFGPGEAAQLQKVGKSALAPQYFGGWFFNPSFSSMVPGSPSAGQDEKGSEKPTLDQTSGGGLLKETQIKDFRAKKIFQIESQKIFLANSSAISADGRKFLDTFASYVRQLPDRIIVSEIAAGDTSQIPLLRAVSIVEYFGARGIAKERCGVGITGIVPQSNRRGERMLEISLIDEGSYK